MEVDGDVLVGVSHIMRQPAEHVVQASTSKRAASTQFSRCRMAIRDLLCAEELWDDQCSSLLWRQLRGLRGATVASSTLACTVGAFSVCRRGEAFLKASMHCRRDRVTPG